MYCKTSQSHVASSLSAAPLRLPAGGRGGGAVVRVRFHGPGPIAALAVIVQTVHGWGTIQQILTEADGKNAGSVERIKRDFAVLDEAVNSGTLALAPPLFCSIACRCR